jgi:hypothetical protein
LTPPARASFREKRLLQSGFWKIGNGISGKQPFVVFRVEQVFHNSERVCAILSGAAAAEG